MNEEIPENKSNTESAEENIRRLSLFLDDAFEIPIIKKTVGWDGIIGLIPGIGDIATSALSVMLIVEAKKGGVPKHVLWRMSLWAGFDFLLGLTPIIGDAIDFFFKANKRNAKFALKHLEKEKKNDSQ